MDLDTTVWEYFVLIEGVTPIDLDVMNQPVTLNLHDPRFLESSASIHRDKQTCIENS